MKSTGEVMGKDATLEKALYKGLVAAGMEIRTEGTVLFTISDKDKEEAIALAKRFSTVGYRIVATEGTAKAFEEAHSLGMATVLWCYLRNSAFKVGDKDYHLAADLTGQANHLGVTIKADIIKQKLPELNGGFKALNMGKSSYGKLDERMYTELSSDHPIDLCRYQVLNCFAGRAGLINSGGASGQNDIQEAVKTAVINKRAGGTGLISGRKAFQKPMNEGVALLHAIQDVYLCDEVSIA